jgi:hypothetical protein
MRVVAIPTLILLAVCIADAHAGAQETTMRKPITRKDAFLGMHFDLHPGKTDTSLGADITEENIAALLDRVKPDFVQYDCKGHAGYTGYPTKIGWSCPGIVQDSLAIWRKVTREHGVGLYIHYSGDWDAVAIEHHPDWAAQDANGKPDPNATSVFGPYVDTLMIPELKEVAAAYDIDGMWVDGECWGARLDWSPAAMVAWRAETGYTDAPKKRGDPYWQEWKQFHRRHFEQYVKHWVDALHAFRPSLQITSNWMYSSMAPLPVKIDLDFLSGDFSSMLALDRARVEARYFASTGKPWDLMSWGFIWGAGQLNSLKPAVQLQQEASVVLMQGGGIQVYYNPTRSGYIMPEIINTMGQVADFCRARQKVSHKSTTVPQVALLYSAESMFERSDSVFSPFDEKFEILDHLDATEGALHALLELGYSVDLLAEHQLQPRLSDFPLVVIPDSHVLTAEFRDALLRYVKGGGNLLLLGASCAKLFAAQVGVRFEGDPAQVATELLTSAGIISADGVWQKVTATTAQVVAQRYPTRDTRKSGEVAATWTALGNGRIAAVYGPVARNHFHSHHPCTRRLIGDLAAKLFPDPAVRIDGPPCLDVSLRRTKTGKLSLHMLNTTNMQVSPRHVGMDFVPPVGPITAHLRVPEKPKRVSWVPDGGRVKWSWADGRLTVMVPAVHVHGGIVVE